MELKDCVREYMKAELGAFSEASLSATVELIAADIKQAQETGNLAWMESGFRELCKSFIARKLPLAALDSLRDHLASIFPEFQSKIEKEKELAQWINNNLPEGTTVIVDENLPIGTVLPLSLEEYRQYTDGKFKMKKH